MTVTVLTRHLFVFFSCITEIYIYSHSELQWSLELHNVILDFYFQIKLFCWGIKHWVHCGKFEINIAYQTRADCLLGSDGLCGTHSSITHSFSSCAWWTWVDSSLPSVNLVLNVAIFNQQSHRSSVLTGGVAASVTPWHWRVIPLTQICFLSKYSNTFVT